MFPKDEAGFSIDDQWYVGGSGLLVKPVTQQDVTEASIYLAEDQVCCINCPLSPAHLLIHLTGLL